MFSLQFWFLRFFFTKSPVIGLVMRGITTIYVPWSGNGSHVNAKKTKKNCERDNIAGTNHRRFYSIVLFGFLLYVPLFLLRFTS